MALLPQGTKPTITLRDTLYPLFVLYAVSYGLMLQQTIESTSKTLLFIKFLLGIVILGVPSLYILKRKSDFSVTLLPKKINILLVLFSVLFGLFILHGFVALKILFPLDTSTFLLYYGFFNPLSHLYRPLMLSLGVYVLAEELFFRGVIYQYVRSRYGVLVGSLLTALIFAVAHLNFYIPLLLLLVTVSLAATALIEKTNTYFYGFIMHATLDIVALLFLTSGPALFLYNYIYLRTLYLALVVAVFAWALFVSPWSKKLLSL